MDELLESLEPAFIAERAQGTKTDVSVHVTPFGHHAKVVIVMKDVADGTVFGRIPLRVTRERLSDLHAQIGAVLDRIEAFDGIPEDRFA